MRLSGAVFRASRHWVSGLAVVLVAGVTASAAAIPLTKSGDESSSGRTRRTSRPATVPKILQARATTTAAITESRSLGWPWQGQLISGVAMNESETIRYIEPREREEHFFGTAALVDLIEHAASSVAAELPGSKLTVGDLSRRRGGTIIGHKSHQSGRDIDVGFYLQREDGTPYYQDKFMFVGRRGNVPRAEGVRFDDARNWHFVQTLLQSESPRVQFIFVSRGVRSRLLQEAVRQGVSSALLERAADVLNQPANAESHADHFHVRIHCPGMPSIVRGPQYTDGTCRDKAPFWEPLGS